MIDEVIEEGDAVGVLKCSDIRLINTAKTRVDTMTVILNRIMERPDEFLFFNDCRSLESQVMRFLSS